MGSSVDTLSMNSLNLEAEESEDGATATTAGMTARAMPSAPPMGRPRAHEDGDGELWGEDDMGESANIPLMRIVMSKKQTKRPGKKILKEGWVVHYTNKNNMVQLDFPEALLSVDRPLLQRKKHYWRLDTKSIVMYQDENSSRYHRVSLGTLLSL